MARILRHEARSQIAQGFVPQIQTKLTLAKRHFKYLKAHPSHSYFYSTVMSIKNRSTDHAV
ncbi:hypothetical protein BN1200_310030 [Klebsiella variicola]|nr:hypothetical protein BN1200_310030 [Klebsiella variicola]